MDLFGAPRPVVVKVASSRPRSSGKARSKPKKLPKWVKQERSLRKRFPAKDYATIRVRRGGNILDSMGTTTDMFGSSSGVATDMQKAARKQYGYYGKGFYKGFGSDLGSLAGRTIGNLTGLGGDWGSDIGRRLGGWGARATGFGSYAVNDAIEGGSDIPSFTPQTDTMGNVTISYKEYVCDVYGSSDPFSIFALPLNPGLPSSFPYLSQIAQNYEEYTLHQCMFTYKSNIAPIGASGSGQVGEIIMGTNYNASQPVWQDKQSMLQSALTASSRASSSMLHGVECDPAKLSGAPGKYVRAGPVGHDEDIKSYDHGLFQLAVTGIPASYINQPLGQLWVSYTVSLRKPRAFTSKGFGITRDTFAVLTAPGTAPTTQVGDLLGVKSGKTLFGANNNLGIVPLNPSPPGLPFGNACVAALQFPNTYTGIVRIRLLVQQVNAGGATSNTFQMVLPSSMEFVPDTIWGSSSPVPPAGGIGISGGVQNLAALSTSVEWHVRVTQVGLAGVPNIAVINNAVGDGANATVDVQVDVEEYNTAFNNSQDKLQLVDVDGNPVSIVA